MNDKPLNAQELLFKDKYLLTGKVIESAIHAGYAETTAKSKAFNWVSDSGCPENKQHLLNAIRDAQAKRAENTKIDADWVLLHLGDMIKADPCDIIDKKTGCYIPIHQWPLVWRQMLSAADVQEIYKTVKKKRKKVGEIIKYKFIDKLRAFEMVGKHVDVQAFKDKVEMIHRMSHEEALDAMEHGSDSTDHHTTH